MQFERPKRVGNKVPVITAEEAAALIPDGCTVYAEGDNIGHMEPTKIYKAMAKHFTEENTPRDLTLILTTGVGDRQADSDQGYSTFAIPGFAKRLISSILGQSPKLAAMADRGEVEAYGFSMGTVSQMMRAAVSHQPGIISKVGIGTFIDPRIRGGKLNDKTTEDMVRLMEIDGEEYLFYKVVAPDVTLLRMTTVDELGYATSEEEVGPRFLDDLAAAQAAHNNGGIVIVQAKQMVEAGSLKSYDIRVPGMLVDYVVLDPEQAQSYDSVGKPTNNFITGQLRSTAQVTPHPLSERKVIVRRALMEARPGMIGNIGFGVMGALSGTAHEEDVLGEFTLTGETGMIGGISGPPLTAGAASGPAVNIRAITPMADMFSFYEGGGLDICYLSFAQVDQDGNVNVSLLNHKIMGTGGFVHISQCARKVVFGGTMTAGGFKAKVGNGKLEILQEGKFQKFPKQVDEISFSGKESVKKGTQEVFYVTERCVFKLTEQGVTLIEIAPGMDVEKDILAYMDFRPAISKDLKLMDSRFFCEGKMHIREEWLQQ